MSVCLWMILYRNSESINESPSFRNYTSILMLLRLVVYDQAISVAASRASRSSECARHVTLSLRNIPCTITLYNATAQPTSASSIYHKLPIVRGTSPSPIAHQRRGTIFPPAAQTSSRVHADNTLPHCVGRNARQREEQILTHSAWMATC